MLIRKSYRTLALASLIAAGVGTSASAATISVVNETFDGYNTGNLAGQGGWTALSAAGTNPIQVTAGKSASLTTSGEDDYLAFTASGVTGPAQVSHDDGGSLTTSFTLTTSAAQATGDYFLHVSTPAGGNNFYQRVFAKSTTGGYLLGLVDTSGTGSTVSYGTTVLNLNQTYNVAVTWNFVAGANNDTFGLTVDGNSYLNTTWTSASAEPTTIQAINLRQGTASQAPTVVVDNLNVSAANAAVAAVPEPTSLALVGIAGGSLLIRRRRR